MYNVSSKICLAAMPLTTMMSNFKAIAIKRLSAASEMTGMNGADD